MDQVFIFHKSTIDSSSVEEHSSGTNVDFFSSPLSNLVSISAIEGKVIFYFREGNLFENSKANMAKVTVNVTAGKEARTVSEFWSKIKRDQYPEGIIFIDDESSRYSLSYVTSISSINRYTTERFSSGGGGGSFVPYTGATADVDLGAFGLITDYVEFSLTPTAAPGAGQIAYVGNTGALAYNMNNSAVTCQIGQTIHAYVHNAEAVTINKGEAVYLFGASGNKASVKLAYNTSDATSAKTFGLAAENITAGTTGFIICQGVLDGIDTSMYVDGDSLYLDATAGDYTATKPYAPNHLVYIGTVERANAGNGQIYVRIQNGYELDELHTVNINHNVVLNDKDYLVYNNGNSLWENRPLDIVNDTTPQLGGNLDVNTYKIVSTSNGNIELEPNGTGDVYLTSDTVRVGDSNANATITTNGTGDLIINTNSGTNSGNITITNGTNGNITVAPNGTGTVRLDADTIRVGDVNTTATITTNGTGDLLLNTNSGTTSGSINITTGSNGPITIAPNGTGSVRLDADTIRTGDTGGNVTITTNGTGDLTLNTNSGSSSGSITILDGANGNISITPNGTGNVVLDGINYPQADGSNGQVLQTNGSAQLSFYTLKHSYYDIAPTQAGTIAAATTLYYVAGNNTSSATQNLRQKSYGEDVTLKNLYFRTYGTQPGTGSLVINITSATAYTGAYTNRITVTIAAGSAAGHYENTSTTYTLTKGDYAGMSVQNNATGASAGFTGFGYKVEYNAI